MLYYLLRKKEHIKIKKQPDLGSRGGWSSMSSIPASSTQHSQAAKDCLEGKQQQQLGNLWSAGNPSSSPYDPRGRKVTNTESPFCIKYFQSQFLQPLLWIFTDWGLWALTFLPHSFSYLRSGLATMANVNCHLDHVWITWTEGLWTGQWLLWLC